MSFNPTNTRLLHRKTFALRRSHSVRKKSRPCPPYPRGTQPGYSRYHFNENCSSPDPLNAAGTLQSRCLRPRGDRRQVLNSDHAECSPVIELLDDRPVEIHHQQLVCEGAAGNQQITAARVSRIEECDSRDPNTKPREIQRIHQLSRSREEKECRCVRPASRHEFPQRRKVVHQRQIGPLGYLLH